MILMVSLVMGMENAEWKMRACECSILEEEAA